MVEKQQVDDLVTKLDRFMKNGGGHMNVDTDKQQKKAVEVNRFRFNECSTGRFPSACAVPTLTEGLDQNEE